MIRSMLCPILAGIVCSAAAQEPATKPLPFELAFDRRTIRNGDQPKLSPGGRRVAYVVLTPPRGQQPDVRYLPNGTPRNVLGAAVYVTDIASGKATRAGPAGAASWRPSWAPDGRKLAFYSDAGGYPQLWIYEVESARSRVASPVRIKPKLWSGDAAAWSSDGQTLFVPTTPDEGPRANGEPTGDKKDDTARIQVFKSGKESGASHEDTLKRPITSFFIKENNAALCSVDLATGATTTVVTAATTPRPSVLRLSPSGRWISYLSVFKPSDATTQVSVMDLAIVKSTGGAVRVIATGLPLESGSYFGLHYRWHPTEDRLVFVSDGGLWCLDLTTDPTSAPYRLAPAHDDLRQKPLLYLRNGSAVLVASKDAGTLLLVPLAGSEPRRLSIPEPWSYQFPVATDDRVLWQPNANAYHLWLRKKATGESAAMQFNLKTGAATIVWKGRAQLDRPNGGGHHDALVAVYQDVGTPPDVYRFRGDLSQKERLTTVEPRLETVRTAGIDLTTTSIPTHTGRFRTVHTAVLWPHGSRRDDRLPAVVMVYGGSDLSRYADRFGGGAPATIPALLFASRGYAVVFPNLPMGPLGRAGDPVQEIVDALLPQIYRLCELGYLDRHRLAVMGQSYGGYSAAAIVSRTKLFRAAVSISGLFDLGGLYGRLRNDGHAFFSRWSEGGQGRMGQPPWSDLKRYIDNSPYYQADKIRTPLLLVHGDQDNAIDDARKMFNALRRLHRTAQLAVYEGEGHVPREWSLANSSDAAKRIVDFLGRYTRK